MSLPSLSLGSTPWAPTHRYYPVGGGGRRSREPSLLSSLDEVPLVSGGEDDDDDEDDSPRLVRRKWQRHLTGRRWLSGDGIKVYLLQLWQSIRCCRKPPAKSRHVIANSPDPSVTYPPNTICNQKYSILSFLPKVLFEQFKFFLNFYFLVISLTQLIPPLRIGYWYTYWGPLLFVICITMLRELLDDFKRFLRDKEINLQMFTKLTEKGEFPIHSSRIQVSDVIHVHKNQRVPADMVLLRTTEKNGSCFLRTDQLDGETDWKLRVAVQLTQQMVEDKDLFSCRLSVFAEKPQQDIHSFVGKLSMSEGSGTDPVEDPLSADNMLWANTVLASGSALGLVVYTGKETRSAMNTSNPVSKLGQVDLEINRMTKSLFLGLILLSLCLLVLKGFSGPWFVYLLRYVILFSYIIPISLRVNLDMAKLVYSFMIQRDKAIPGTLVRSSTISEELGRIGYLLSDKTGTLTQNEMVFRKLHIGSVSFGQESTSEVRETLQRKFIRESPEFQLLSPVPSLRPRTRYEQQLVESVLALAICHNVTPVIEEVGEDEGDDEGRIEEEDEEVVLFTRRERGPETRISYQASSPDEIALVSWTGKVDVTLAARELNSLRLKLPNDQSASYEILHIFPFTSERKRMGIIVKEKDSGIITFYMKGADVVMSNIVQYSDWLEEECGNMAREGLRTLVVGRRILTEEQYSSFDTRYRQAKLNVTNRTTQTAAVMETLEENLELLCVTGVEDKLQVDVRPTLELLRNAGIKVWMLTGDKLETATSIALSSRLITRNQTMYTFQQVTNRSEVHSKLNNLRKRSVSVLIITGSALELCLKHYETEFVEIACQLPAVVCCRCTPTHKETVVKLLRTHTKRPICAIGDGGNDVSMIQAANVGVGIVGKEGKQASLAADFSITQFRHISRLLVWHGRNCYKRSASLSQFVMHRGLLISTMQAVFSAMFYFVAVSLYEGILMVGYATVYTMAPVFSLVLDEDVSADIALTYPELYQELMKGRSLSLKSFFVWVVISIYQGGVIMLLGFWLFEDELIHVVSITFTALILTELLMVALTIRTWHGLMMVAELLSIVIYIGSLLVLRDYFDLSFLKTFGFIWKTLLLTAVSCVPLSLFKIGIRLYAPPSYAKLLKKNSMFRNCCRFKW